MKIKVSDYIVDFFYKNGIDTLFTITGGFAMHLNDSFGKHDKYNIYYQHHEQACGYSALGYSKTNLKPVIVCTTAGCAATNVITPCLVAHQDSLPILFISGQVKSNETINAINTENSTAIARDIWKERRETIRERIHLIGDRMTLAASQLAEDQLLNKADKIKIATEIAGKSVGLDREEDRNQVNIAILGAIDSRPGTYGEIIEGEVWSESGRNLHSNSVEHTESESVTHHPTHHGPP
jgi:TPP-dependent 2-oxoacid decarboxylase